MKIVKKTSNILDLEIAEFRYLIRLSLALMIGGFMVIIGGFPLLHKESVILECDRLESNYVDCNITRNSLLRKETVNFPQLKKAEIEKIDLEDTTAYRINLMGSMGKLSLNTNYIYNKLESQNLVDKINKFLGNNVSDNPNFKLEYYDPLYSYLGNFMMIILGVGISLLIMTPLDDTNYIFDKETNTIWRVQKNIFVTKKLFYLPLSDITKAEVMKSQKIDDDESTNVYNVYHLVLKKRSCSISLKAEEIDENGMIVLTSDTIEIMEEIIKNHIILKAEGIETNKNQYIDIKDSINNFLR